MKIFISGGCKNGKSSYAQRLSQALRKPGAPLYYLATMIPSDGEDETRISRHRRDREGCGFETVEAGRDILAAVGGCDRHGTFLLDSVTALLANEMFTRDGRVERGAHIKIAGELAAIMDAVDGIVIVSDFIYSDGSLYEELTETYRRGLAYIDRRTAGLCDIALEACGGICVAHKGGELLYGLV